VRGDERRLSDIIDAIEQIDRYAARGKDAFDTEELVQVWMLHHLEIIGEALWSMSDEFRATYKDRWDWAGWIGLRIVIAHQYFHVQPQIIWQTVERDVPILKEAVTRLQHELGSDH